MEINKNKDEFIMKKEEGDILDLLKPGDDYEEYSLNSYKKKCSKCRCQKNCNGCIKKKGCR